MKAPPPSWQSDALSEHFGGVFDNTWATFVHKKAAHRQLVEVDAIFFKLADGTANAGMILEGIFLLRAHVAFRAGTLLVYSTQLPEAFPLFRSSLECALYGLHVHVTPAANEIWIKRSDGTKDREAARTEFSHGRVKRTLLSKDATLGAQIETLYERTIDFGGHPNDQACFGAMQTETKDGSTIWKQQYFAGSGLALDHGLKTASQIGVGALSIFQLVWKQRFQILGLDQRLSSLKNVL